MRLMQYILLASAVLVICLAGGCGRGTENEVVIYTPVDREFAEPILKEFENETGIKVKALYDAEAAKGAGLTNRVLAEKQNPQCDVWWNSEFARTRVLKDAGVLQPYDSPSARDIPEQFKDPDGCWTGYAVRARVIIYNTKLVSKETAPDSVLDLADPKWKGKIGLPNPAFGTASSHFAGLFLELGDSEAKAFFTSLKKNDLVICPGNAHLRDRVVAGDLAVGVVDTDDAHVSIARGEPLGMVFPDQNGIGTFVIPNTVAMVKDCPHQDAAKKLIDYLLSRDVEAKLALCGSAQIPVREGVAPPKRMPALGEFRASKVDYVEVSHKMSETNRWLTELLVR